MGRTLFVSYSRADGEQVSTLVSDLEGFDHSTWMDRELTGGLDWWSEVLRRIRECDLFLYAVSQDSVTSEACLREYEYAEALGKPVLPVTVRRGASDALLPASLGHIQRVDYSEPDRASLTQLIKSINSIPPAPPSPDPLPAEPEIPATYLYDLNQEIGSSEEMTSKKQDEILDQLSHQANQGETPEAVRHMIGRMRQRDDLLVRSSSQLDQIEASLPKAGTAASQPQQPPAPKPTQPAETQPSPSPPATPPQQVPRPVQPPAQSATPPIRPVQPTRGQVGPGSSQPVNPGWWIATILIPVVGGFVAWLAVKDQDATAGRNMLLVGLAWIFVFFVCFGLLASGELY